MAEKHVELIDVYRAFDGHRTRLDYFPDGLHPDDAGSVEMIRRWAEAAAPLYP